MKLSCYKTRDGYHGALNTYVHMLFPTYQDMIDFVLEVGVCTVLVETEKQQDVPYGYRLDVIGLRDSISVAQCSRKGRKRSIIVTEQ